MKTIKKSFAKRVISTVLASTLVTGIFAGTGVSINAKAADLSALPEAVGGGSVKKLSDFINSVNPYDRNYTFSAESIVNGSDLVSYDKATAINDSAAFYSDEGELSAEQIKRDPKAERGTAKNPFLLVEIVPNELTGAFFQSFYGASLLDYKQMKTRFLADSDNFVQYTLYPETSGTDYSFIQPSTPDLKFFSEEDAKAAQNYIKAIGGDASYAIISNDVRGVGTFDGTSGKYFIEKDGIKYYTDDTNFTDSYGNSYAGYLDGKTAYEFVTYEQSGGVYKATSGNYAGKDVSSMIEMDGGAPVVYVKSNYYSQPYNLDAVGAGFKVKSTATESELNNEFKSSDYVRLTYTIDATSKSDIYKYLTFKDVPNTLQWYGYYYEAANLEKITIDGVERLCATDGKGHIVEISSDGKRYDKNLVESEAAAANVIWVGLDYYINYYDNGDLRIDDIENEEVFFASCKTGITSQYTYVESGSVVSKMKQYAIRTAPVYNLHMNNQYKYTAIHHTDYFKKYAIGQFYGAPTPKKDENGKQMYETDDDGNILYVDGQPVEALNKDRTTWTWSESDTAALKSVVLKLDKYHANVILTTPEDLNVNLSLINNADLILFNDFTSGMQNLTESKNGIKIGACFNKDFVDYDADCKKVTAYYNNKYLGANSRLSYKENDLSWKAVKMIALQHFKDELPVMMSDQTPYRSGTVGVKPAPGIDISIAGSNLSANWNGIAGINDAKAVGTNYEKLFTILNSMNSESFMALWWDRLEEDVMTSSKILYKDGTVRYNTTGYLDTRRDTTSSDKTGVLENWGFNNLVPYYKLATSYDSLADFKAALISIINKYGILVQTQDISDTAGNVSNVMDSANDLHSRVMDYVYVVQADQPWSQQMRMKDGNTKNGNYGEVYGWFEEQGDSDLDDTDRSSNRNSYLLLETIFYYLINSTGNRNRFDEAIGDINVLEIQADDEYMSSDEWDTLLDAYFGSYRKSTAKTNISRVNVKELSSFNIDNYVKYDMIYFGGKGNYDAEADITEKGLYDLVEYSVYRPVIFGSDLFDIQANAYSSGSPYITLNQVDTRRIVVDEDNISDKLKNSNNLYSLFIDTQKSDKALSKNLKLENEYDHPYYGDVEVNVYSEVVLLGALRNFHFYENFIQTFLDEKVYRMETLTSSLTAADPENGVNARLKITFTGKASTTATASELSKQKYIPVIYVDSNYDGYFDKEEETASPKLVATTTTVTTKDNTSLNKMVGAINYLVELRIGSMDGIVVDSWQGVVAKTDTELGINVLEITKKGSQTAVISGISAGAGAVDLKSQLDVFENIPGVTTAEGASETITYDSASSDMIANGTVDLTNYDIVVVGLKDDFDSEADVSAYINDIKAFAESGTVIIGKGAAKTKSLAKLVGIDVDEDKTTEDHDLAVNNILNAYSTDDLKIDAVSYTLAGATGGSEYLGYKLTHAFQNECGNITEWPYKINDSAVIGGTTTLVPRYKVVEESVTDINHFTPYYTVNSNYTKPAKADYVINDASDQYYAYAYSTSQSDGTAYTAYYTGISNNPTADETQIYVNMLISAYVRSLILLNINIENSNKSVSNDTLTYLYYTSDAGDPTNIQVITNDATIDTATLKDDVFAVTSGSDTTYYKRVYFTLTNAAAEGGAFITNFYTYRKKADPFSKANALMLTDDVYTDVFTTAAGSELDLANLKDTISPKIYYCTNAGGRIEPVDYSTVKIGGKNYSGYVLNAGSVYCYDMKLNNVKLYGVDADSIIEPYVGIVGLYVPTNTSGVMLPDRAKPDNKKHYVYMNVKALASSLFRLD